jgi:mannonate dehydratase
VPAENQANFRLIRQHTTTPLAVGEIFNSIWDCKQLIEEQLIDYIRATVVHAGGITHLRRIAALADLNNVRTGCHGATDLSPVSMAAALTSAVDPQLRDPGIHAPHRRDRRGVPACLQLRRRPDAPGETPGLGVEIDEALARKHEYSRAYLPVNRLEDGSMYNW